MSFRDLKPAASAPVQPTAPLNAQIYMSTQKFASQMSLASEILKVQKTQEEQNLPVINFNPVVLAFPNYDDYYLINLIDRSTEVNMHNWAIEHEFDPADLKTNPTPATTSSTDQDANQPPTSSSTPAAKPTDSTDASTSTSAPGGKPTNTNAPPPSSSTPATQPTDSATPSGSAGVPLIPP